jgi:hypothetical protein
MPLASVDHGIAGRTISTMTRQSTNTDAPRHPLHTPVRRRWGSSVSALATGVTLGLLALGVYSFLPESVVNDTGLPGGAKLMVDAPADAVLDQPELEDLMSCIDDHVAKQTGTQLSSAAVMAKAQQVCTDKLRGELMQD